MWYTVSWSPVDGSYNGYALYENGDFVANVGPSFELSHESGSYVYQIAARNSCGESPLSQPSEAVVIGTRPQDSPMPTSSSASPCFDQDYVMSWMPDSEATSYLFFENGFLVYSGSDTQVIRNQYAGTFRYHSRSVNACGAGANSDTTIVVIAECQCHGDPYCDGVRVDAADVVATIDIVFRGSTDLTTKTCSQRSTDFDCSGQSDIVDVVTSVDVAFRHVDPALRICNPCP